MAGLKEVLNKIFVGCVCLDNTGLKNKPKFNMFLDYSISLNRSNGEIQINTVSPEGATVMQHV